MHQLPLHVGLRPSGLNDTYMLIFYCSTYWRINQCPFPPTDFRVSETVQVLVPIPHVIIKFTG